MSVYSVVEGRAVTADDINEARMLDQMVYEEEYYVTLEQCLAWHRKNDRIYTMIRDNTTKRIIAYVNISPVTVEYYEKIRSGQFIDTYLPAEAIVEYALPDTYHLYFSSIVVHPDYQNSTVFLLLFNAITNKFLELGREEILVERIVADAVSDKGRKFCELFGMQKQKNSDHNSQIYEVQMMPPAFRVSSKATKELHSYYQSKAAELGFTAADTADRGKEEKQPIVISGAARVFISYSSDDVRSAEDICRFLENNGILCWMAPRNIDPGANYATQIVKAIRDSEVLVLVASESINVSNHVSNEVSIAFDNKKVIIPFKIEDVSFSDEYLYFLGRKHWINAYLNPEAGLENLLTTAKNILQEGKNVREPETVQQEKILQSEPAEAPAVKPDFVSEEEIVRCILKKIRKYKNSNFERFSRDYEYYKAHANAILSRCYNVTRYNRVKKVENCIDYLIDELINDNDAEAIRVSGLPGSGKGILLQAAFYEILQKFRKGQTKYLPFYLAQGYYEKFRFGDENQYERVKESLQNELSEFLAYVEAHEDVEPILFVDEVREHRIGKIPLENILLDIIREHDIYKRVVAVDSGLTKNRNRIKRVLPIISEKVSAAFESHKVDSHDETEAKAFIEDIIDFNEYEISADTIFEVIKRLKFQEIDIHVVKALAEELMEAGAEINNISDMYESWALREFEGNEKSLYKAARNTFEYLFDDNFDLGSIDFNDPQWRLIHRHQTYLDLLISYYMIREIGNYDGQKDYDCDFLQIMLTASTDKFAGAFLENNYALQEKLFDIVTENFERFEVVQKSSAIFWLAKITYPNLISDGVAFLKKRYEEMKPVVKNCNSETQANYDNQFLFRAICFCMIVYGQTAVLDDYLCLLITNDTANAINRGAIVEYYGEQYQMAANETYCLDTDIRRGKNAIKALRWKISKAMRPGPNKNKMLEMDLMTICTLFQKRMQSNESRSIPEIRGWISDMVMVLKKYKMRPQNTKSEKIGYYFDSINEDFSLFLESEKGFDVCQHVYNNLRALRDVKRKQWQEKAIEDPESISEHSYSAWMMAMLFLPDELKYEEYSKKEILDMLLIHDMAEATLGDQVLDLNEPAKELREQNTVMRKLFVKGSYPNMANLTYYYNIWTGYYNGSNINAKIARDINLIQSVYTFCEYFVKHPNCFAEEDRLQWVQEKGKLETEIGYSIFEKLVENNYDFAGFFDHSIKAGAKQEKKAEPAPKEEQPVQTGGEMRKAKFNVMRYEDLLTTRADITSIKNEIIGIVESIFPENPYLGAADNLKMLESISENWRVLLNQENEIVGYWVFVALQEEYFERVKQGTLDEKEITLDTIEFIDFPGNYKGYLLMSGTKPEARTAALVQTLYESLALHIQSLAAKGIFFDEIAALAESPMGISTMRKLGMKEIGKHVYGGKIFACELTDINENRYFSSFGELRDLYNFHFKR